MTRALAKKTKQFNKPKRKIDKDGAVDGLWIAPRYSLKDPTGERTWGNRRGGAPNSGKYLELADIALGLKKAEPASRKRGPVNPHVTDKTEPYSS